MVDGVVGVGTRASALARAQTAWVLQALVARWPAVVFELVPISTSGDRSQATNQPGADWGTGVFVKELEAALLRGEIDLAVHSLKDVPPVVPPGLSLAAFPRREDPLDVLATPDGRGLDGLASGARVGTSSARRVAFLRARRPDLIWLPIRGNVGTRLEKLAAGHYDAVVLARAGLRRLGLEVPHVVLDPGLLPPAPGQGALALEARADDQHVLALVEPLHHPATAAAVRAERRLMDLLDGGCRLPVGALGTPGPDGQLDLLGGLVGDDGVPIIEQTRGSLDAPDALADALAARLRAPGGPARPEPVRAAAARPEQVVCP